MTVIGLTHPMTVIPKMNGLQTVHFPVFTAYQFSNDSATHLLETIYRVFKEGIRSIDLIPSFLCDEAEKSATLLYGDLADGMGDDCSGSGMAGGSGGGMSGGSGGGMSGGLTAKYSTGTSPSTELVQTCKIPDFHFLHVSKEMTILSNMQN